MGHYPFLTLPLTIYFGTIIHTDNLQMISLPAMCYATNWLFHTSLSFAYIHKYEETTRTSLSIYGEIDKKIILTIVQRYFTECLCFFVGSKIVTSSENFTFNNCSLPSFKSKGSSYLLPLNDIKTFQDLFQY